MPLVFFLARLGLKAEKVELLNSKFTQDSANWLVRRCQRTSTNSSRTIAYSSHDWNRLHTSTKPRYEVGLITKVDEKSV